MTPITGRCHPWSWLPPLPGPHLSTAAVTSMRWLAAVDTVAGVRQFEISGPVATAPLGRSNNYPRSVANRIGAEPARAILEIVGGQGPQHLISELAAEIAAGRSTVALIFGSDATSTLRHFARATEGSAKPDFTETVDGALEDRGQGIDGLISRYTVVHGLIDAPTQYGLLENARRAGTGLGPAEYRRQMGELFAPFTKIAASNPFAAAPVERTVDELITVSERNRMISEPVPPVACRARPGQSGCRGAADVG